MDKFNLNVDPDKLPLPLIPPLLPRQTESALERRRSFPDLSTLSDPDKDGYYWSKEWTTVKNINVPPDPKPIVNKSQIKDIEGIINRENDYLVPREDYAWSVTLHDPLHCDPPQGAEGVRQETTRHGRPETRDINRSNLKQKLRGVFRSKSPKEKDVGTIPKNRIASDNDHYVEIPSRADQEHQIRTDMNMAMTLNRDLERSGPYSKAVTQQERDALEREERDLIRLRQDNEAKLRREREHERDEFDRKRQLIKQEKEKLQRGRTEVTSRDREERLDRDRDHKGKEKRKVVKKGSQEQRRHRSDIDDNDDAYSTYSKSDRSVSPRNKRSNSVKQSRRKEKSYRARGDTVHAISLENRGQKTDSDSDSEGSHEYSNSEIMKEVKKIKKNSGKINIPSLDMVPYPSDSFIGKHHTNNTRAIAGFYKQYEHNRHFARKPNEHIIRYLTRVKRAIEGTKFKMDDRQFLEFCIHFLDTETSNLFHETFEVFENFDKYDFLDYLVTSVVDNKEKGEVNAAFWSYDPKYDSNAKNTITLVTKLSQLMARTNFTVNDMIDKLVVLLPVECVSKIKKHRDSGNQAVGLDVVLFELHKHDSDIRNFLLKNKEKHRPNTGSGVRAVRQVDVESVEVHEGDAEYDTEHVAHLNDEEHVHFVPYRKYPLKSEDVPQNQFVAPKQQQQHFQQQQQSNNNTRYPNNQFRTSKQQVCGVCFRYGHSADTCRMTIYCALCNSTKHTAPTCDIYVGVAPVTDDCPSCLSLFSLRLKHTYENCRLNSNSPFSIAKMMVFPDTTTNQNSKQGE